MQSGPIPPYMFPGMPMSQAPFNVFNKIPMAPPLYIGDLDENTHEETLHDIFSKFGPLHFVRIMRDPATGKSRGFGYVNFLYPRDADTARQFAQYEKVGRKNIRIMFKRNVRDLPPEANIYVRNLDPSVTVKDLYNHFLQNEVDRRGGNTEKGPSSAVIASVKIATNAEGQSLGYGYVQFEKAEDALRALEELQGSKLKESELLLEKFVPKDKREGTAKKNIYIKNLPNNKSEEELEKYVKDLFGKFGEIDAQKVKKHQKHNQFSAFVCYKDEHAAEQALEKYKENPPTLDGAEQPIYVGWHQAKAERTRDLRRQHQQSQNDKNLFIKNLKAEVTEADLKNAFQSYGKINSVACKEWQSKDSQKKAKFAFVAFDNSDDATRALNDSVNSQEIKNLFIADAKPYIGLHQEKGKRKEYLHTQMKWKNQASGMFNPMDPMRSMQMQMGAGRKFPPFPPMMNPQQLRNFGRGGPSTGKPFQKGGYKPNVGGPRGNAPHKPYTQGQRHMGQQNVQNKKPIQPKTPQQGATSSTGGTAITVQNLRGKLNEFLSLEIDKQRQILGELLFPLIKNISGDAYAPKITGMLIDLTVLEVTEILEFLENPALLQERVQEAIELINSEQA